MSLNNMSKKQLEVQNFLNRAEKIQLSLDKIPLSTPSRIIVKANNEGLGFRFDAYIKEYLEPYVSKETFNSTVKGSHKICETIWSIRQREEERAYNVRAKRVFLLSIFVLFVALIMITIKAYGGNRYGEWLVYVSLALMITSGMTTLALIILSMSYKPKFTNFEEDTIKRLEAYFEKENEFYSKKGMEWIVGDNFFWLELRIRETQSPSRSPLAKTSGTSVDILQAKQMEKLDQTKGKQKLTKISIDQRNEEAEVK